MSRHHSDRPPVTLIDVAAYFSEEEWMRLNEWQKELYQNVMKEVHHALLSLGPLIATTVFSLTAKENEGVYPVDQQNLETSHDVYHFSNDKVAGTNMSLKRNREANKHLNITRHPAEREISDCVIIDEEECLFVNKKVSSRKEKEYRENMKNPLDADAIDSSSGHLFAKSQFSVKEEEECYTMDQQVSERTEITHFPTGFPLGKSDISLRTEDESSENLMDTLNTEFVERRAERSTGHIVGKSFASFSVKEEEKEHTMDHQRKENISIPTSICTSVHSTKQQENRCERTFMNIERDRNFNNKLDLINQHRMKQGKPLNTDTEYESMNLVSDSVNQMETQREHKPYTWTHGGKSFRGLVTQNPQQKIYSVLKVYICSQCGNTFKQSEHEAARNRANKGQDQNICQKCEKSLHKHTKLKNEMEKFAVEKPYTCRECGKGFQNSRTLVIHYRVHTGEKPYICNQCGKAFRQLPHLVVHQRLHTGEKPYVCNVCDSRFINTSNLKRHQQIHNRNCSFT